MSTTRGAATALGAVLAGLLALSACTSGDARTTASGARSSATSPGSASASRTSSTPAASTSTTAPTSAAARALARMSLPERVGQLMMVDCPTSGLADATRTAITRYHVGAVILDGTTTEGAGAVTTLTGDLQGLAPHGVGLFIATDQEGGEVQRLQGSGFSSIPSAVEQGQESPATLRSDAEGWGRELRSAGVDVDLAPVLDTVPAGFGSNPPIGDLDREYGHTPSTVESHGLAVVDGLAAAGVDATVKHFPGLGRVQGNTDTTSGVTDDVTTRDDPYLAPFAAAVRAKVPFVMVSTAVYARIDPDHPAAFSSTIVTGMLRDDLHFHGVVITDDLGAAAQVSGYSVGQRAVDFVRAGGDMVLTVDAGQAQAMTAALVSQARSDRAFAAQVDAAAMLVLQAKQAAGLL